MLGLKPALPRVLSFPRNPRVLMHAQTIFISETDDATAKTERGWYMVASSAGGHLQNTINAGSGLKAMLDKRHLAVAGKFMTLLTLPDGTTQWSSAIPPRPNTKDAVQFVMKLDVTTANGVGPGTLEEPDRRQRASWPMCPCATLMDPRSMLIVAGLSHGSVVAR